MPFSMLSGSVQESVALLLSSVTFSFVSHTFSNSFSKPPASSRRWVASLSIFLIRMMYFSQLYKMYVCFRKSSNIILANVFTEAVIRLDDFEVGLSVFEWLDLLTLSWLLLLASFRHFMGKTCWGTKFNVLYMLIFTLSCFRQPRSFYWNLLK
jgi:hypothetical protein